MTQTDLVRAKEIANAVIAGRDVNPNIVLRKTILEEYLEKDILLIKTLYDAKRLAKDEANERFHTAIYVMYAKLCDEFALGKAAIAAVDLFNSRPEDERTFKKISEVKDRLENANTI